MYSVKLDENKYFTGSYVKIGMVQGGIDLPSLPPTNDMVKAHFYKYDYVSVPTVERIPQIDAVTGEYITDAEGNILYTETEGTQLTLDWVFDNVKYQTYLTGEATKVPVPTIEDQIRALKDENELLKGCVMELADIVFA